jgi:hypothetical protein
MADEPQGYKGDQDEPTIQTRINRLEWAVFGVNGKGGLLDTLEKIDESVEQVKTSVGRGQWLLVTATVSFALMAIATIASFLH